MVDRKSQYKKELKEKSSSLKEIDDSDNESNDENDEKSQNLRCKMVLTCFAPDGSPIIGEFRIIKNKLINKFPIFPIFILKICSILF